MIHAPAERRVRGFRTECGDRTTPNGERATLTLAVDPLGIDVIIQVLVKTFLLGVLTDRLDLDDAAASGTPYTNLKLGVRGVDGQSGYTQGRGGHKAAHGDDEDKWEALSRKGDKSGGKISETTGRRYFDVPQR